MHHHFAPTDPDRLDPRRRQRGARPRVRGGGTTLRVVPTSLRELRALLHDVLVRAGLR